MLRNSVYLDQFKLDLDINYRTLHGWSCQMKFIKRPLILKYNFIHIHEAKVSQL